MDIEVITHRIKVKPPKLVMWLDDPMVLDDNEQEKIDQHNAANKDYETALENIYGKTSEIIQGIQWVLPAWASEKMKAELALGWTAFRGHVLQLVASDYALYLDRERLKNEK